jgi:hypothetical protein
MTPEETRDLLIRMADTLEWMETDCLVYKTVLQYALPRPDEPPLQTQVDELRADAGQPERNALVVCEDKLLRDGILGKKAEYGTAVNVVADIGEANALILGLVDEVLRTRRSKEKQEAKEFLLKYRADIEKAVQNIREFSIFEIPNTPFGGSVERILSFEFNDVNSATWKTRTENSATILFSLKCTLTALVGPPLWEFTRMTRRG